MRDLVKGGGIRGKGMVQGLGRERNGNDGDTPRN